MWHVTSCEPIVVATNSSCSTSTTTSPTSDPSLVVENKNLKEEVKKLNHSLAKAYCGEDRLLMCLDSQRASLHKERLGYIPKKGKTVFAPHKTYFVKRNGRYCTKCKKVGHLKHECQSKNPTLMYPQLNLILATFSLRAQMV